MNDDFTHRFYPSKAKAIGDRVIAEELNGVVYDEEDAKHWSITISDKIREAVNGMFKMDEHFKKITMKLMVKSC